MKIKALAKIDGETVPCTGHIEILSIRERQAYVSWQLFHDTKSLGGVSENFFYRKGIDSEESLIKRVIEKIENYRMGRKKIFFNVEIVT